MRPNKISLEDKLRNITGGYDPKNYSTGRIAWIIFTNESLSKKELKGLGYMLNERRRQNFDATYRLGRALHEELFGVELPNIDDMDHLKSEKEFEKRVAKEFFDYKRFPHSEKVRLTIKNFILRGWDITSENSHGIDLFFCGKKSRCGSNIMGDYSFSFRAKTDSSFIRKCGKYVGKLLSPEVQVLRHIEHRGLTLDQLRQNYIAGMNSLFASGQDFHHTMEDFDLLDKITNNMPRYEGTHFLDRAEDIVLVDDSAYALVVGNEMYEIAIKVASSLSDFPIIQSKTDDKLSKASGDLSHTIAHEVKGINHGSYVEGKIFIPWSYTEAGIGNYRHAQYKDFETELFQGYYSDIKFVRDGCRRLAYALGYDKVTDVLSELKV